MRWSGHTYMTWQPKRQRGFIMSAFLAPAVPYIMIGAGVAMLGLGIALYIQSKRLEGAQATIAQTKVVAKQAQREADAQRMADQRNKERSDEEAKRRTAAHAAELSRLRSYTRRSFVPAAPAAAVRPELACFDRAQLDAALRTFIDGVTELVGEGGTATIDLDTAKRWGQGMKR